MQVNDSIITYVASTFYNFTPRDDKICQLDGYMDRNYSIVDVNNPEDGRYVLKIINEQDSKEPLTSIIDEILESSRIFFEDSNIIRIPKLMKTSSNRLSVTCRLRLSVRGELMERDMNCNVKLFKFIEGSMTLDKWQHDKWQQPGFRGLDDENLRTVYKNLGKMCSHLCKFMQTKNHLVEELKKARSQNPMDPWQLTTNFDSLVELADQVFPPNICRINEQSCKRRERVDWVLNEWSSETRLKELPEYLLHGDLNTKNLLMQDEKMPYWLIDFQDIQVGPRVIDLAVLMLYAAIESANPELYEVAIPAIILESYQNENPNNRLNGLEFNLIPKIMRLRLVQSLLCGLRAYELDPGNKYVLSTNARGWDMLDYYVDKWDLIESLYNYKFNVMEREFKAQNDAVNKKCQN